MKALFLCLLVFFGCTRNSKKDDRIEMSLPGEVSTMDPANCYDTICYVPLTQVYESLYEI